MTEGPDVRRPSLRQRLWDGFLLAEAALTLALAHLAVNLFSFRHIAPRLGRRDGATAIMLDAEQQLQARRVAQAVTVISRGRFFKPKCLARMIAGKLMLRRRGIGSTLYLGIRRRNALVPAGTQDLARGIVPHAWLCAGDMAVLGNGGGHRILCGYS